MRSPRITPLNVFPLLRRGKEIPPKAKGGKKAAASRTQV